MTGCWTTLDGIATAGALDRDLIAAMLRTAGEGERRIRAVLMEVMRECEKSYTANCTADLTRFLCRDVPETLEELNSRGAVLGLVTGNLRAIGWKKVELAGLRPYFSVGAFAGDGRTRTQLAQVAAQRARRTGLTNISRRVSLIGDHVNDVAAAKANGFQSVAVASGVLSREQLAEAHPDILVEHLGQLDLSKLL